MFRHIHPEIIESQEAEGIDKVVDPNRPTMNSREQLQQLIRFQRIRMGFLFKHESIFEAILPLGSKEVEVLGRLIETLAKMDGTIDGNGRSVATVDSQDVRENLNTVKKDQITRDRLHSQVKQLVETKA